VTDCDLCDIQRTCDYFAQQGAQYDPVAIIDGLWDRYGHTVDPNDLTADMSRLAMTSGDVSDDGIGKLIACMLESS
jgi:hypothetical protein